MKKNLLKNISVALPLILFTSSVFADGCQLLNQKLEGKWTYREADVEHVLEFQRDEKFVIFDGEQRNYLSCFHYQYSNQINITFEGFHNNLSFNFPKDGDNSKEIQLVSNSRKFNLNYITITSTELLSENNLAYTNGFNWKPEIGFDGQVFPSLIISTASWSSQEGQKKYAKSIKNAEYVGDLNSPVKILIKNIDSDTKIKVEVDLGSLASLSVFEGFL